MADENYESNSNASKEKKHEVVTTNVTVKKQSEGKKFFNNFFQSDAKTIGNYVKDEVLVPNLKQLISNTIRNGVDMLLYGGTRPISNKPTGYTSYSSGYNYISNKPINTIPQSMYKQNSIYAVNDVYFNERGEAEDVLYRLQEDIGRYGMVSVGDFYDMIGQKYTYTDQKYGWKDLSAAEVRRTMDGYSINFPRPIPLN